MSDATYGPKVYHRQGGDVLVVASGGAANVESGGALNVESGASVNIAAGATLTNLGATTRRVITTATNLVLTAAESGAIVITTAVDINVTLPSTAAGLWYTILAGVASTTTGVQIDPAALDKIIGAGVTPADNKDLINTPATDVVGDAVTLVGDGADGWYVVDVVGIWAREG